MNFLKHLWVKEVIPRHLWTMSCSAYLAHGRLTCSWRIVTELESRGNGWLIRNVTWDFRSIRLAWYIERTRPPFSIIRETFQNINRAKNQCSFIAQFADIGCNGLNQSTRARLTPSNFQFQTQRGIANTVVLMICRNTYHCHSIRSRKCYSALVGPAAVAREPSHLISHRASPTSHDVRSTEIMCPDVAGLLPKKHQPFSTVISSYPTWYTLNFIYIL